MGLLDKLKGKKSPKEPFVFMFTFKIKSGRTQIPAPMVGAYVVAYTIADTVEDAVKRAGNELQSMGYTIDDLSKEGGQFALSDWDVHIAERWPEFVGRFPRQHELTAVIARENAVFSPFAGFE